MMINSLNRKYITQNEKAKAYYVWIYYTKHMKRRFGQLVYLPWIEYLLVYVRINPYSIPKILFPAFNDVTMGEFVWENENNETIRKHKPAFIWSHYI